MHADAPPAEPGSPPDPALWQALGWQPQPLQLQQLCRLQALLRSWNQRLNLTRLVEGDDYWIAQVFDSLWPLLPLLNAPQETSPEPGTAWTTADGSASSEATAPGPGSWSASVTPASSRAGHASGAGDDKGPDGSGSGAATGRPEDTTATATDRSAPSARRTAVSAVAPAGTGLNVIDVGTGGGFPGLAVAIALPGAQLTLVDSVQRKLDAVAAMAAELGLADRVRVRAERVERTGRERSCRGRFQLAMARAVAAAPVVAEYLVPLLAPGGQALLYRGQWSGQDQLELERALALLHARISDRQQLELPGGRGLRTALSVEATAACPATYPRAVGVPAKQPLGQAAAASGAVMPRAKARRPAGRSRG